MMLMTYDPPPDPQPQQHKADDPGGDGLLRWIAFLFLMVALFCGYRLLGQGNK